MAVAALVAWLLTAGLGLYMFAIWLIEDDGSIDGKSYRRLRAPVVFGHAGLAVIGLCVWIISIYVHMNSLSWVTLLILALVATLGVFMFTRWIPVHRMYSESADLPARQAAGMAQGRAGPGLYEAGRAHSSTGANAARAQFPAAGGPAARGARGDHGHPGRHCHHSAGLTRWAGPAPEHHFPLPAVLRHGVFAVTTVTLVVIATVLRH